MDKFSEPTLPVEENATIYVLHEASTHHLRNGMVPVIVGSNELTHR
jgi:hypothetical protein